MATQNTSNPKKQATIEQTKHELSAAPLTVMAQYIKDFSFENPNPLQTLKESHEAPEMNLNLDIQANPVEEHIFEITLHLKAEAKRASHTLFIAELQYAGTFKIGENVPKEFQTEQTHVVRNKAGEIIEGSPKQIEQLVDLWTFERNLTQSNPNWFLIKTAT